MLVPARNGKKDTCDALKAEKVYLKADYKVRI